MGKSIVKGKCAPKVKKHLVTAKPFHMSEAEKGLAREMHFQRKMLPSEVAKTLGRDLSAVCRLLSQKRVPKPQGRPKRLDKEQVDKIVSLLEKMVDEADANYEVSLEMLMKRSKAKACSKVMGHGSPEGHCKKVSTNALPQMAWATPARLTLSLRWFFRPILLTMLTWSLFCIGPAYLACAFLAPPAPSLGRSERVA